MRLVSSDSNTPLFSSDSSLPSQLSGRRCWAGGCPQEQTYPLPLSPPPGEGGREGGREEIRDGIREGRGEEGREGGRQRGRKPATRIWSIELDKQATTPISITVEVGAWGVPHMAGFSKLKHELGLTQTELLSLLSCVSHKAIKGSSSI